MLYRKPLLAAALFASATVLGLNPVLAQTTPVPGDPAAVQSQARHHAGPRMLPGQLVDGRIAFFKAELKITPEQETQWQSVATALRQNANALDEVIKNARQQRGTMDAV